MNFAYTYKINENWYAKINENVYGPYNSISRMRLANKDFAFMQQKDGKWYLELNISE